VFTGIIHGPGTVVAVTDREKFREIVVDAGDLVPSPSIGASVCVSGTCLTITKIDGSRLTFEVMEETLNKTTTGALKAGDLVCVESSMKAGDEIGGHFVLGHVDGVGEIVGKIVDGENTRIRFRVPSTIVKYIVPKGSIAIDGISLTVCDPASDCFDVWLLPLTLERTTLGVKNVGDHVNLEADYLLKAVLK
jgi:riboflavin synthase